MVNDKCGIVIVKQVVVMCNHSFTIPFDPISFKKGNVGIPKPTLLYCVDKRQGSIVKTFFVPLCTACLQSC